MITLNGVDLESQALIVTDASGLHTMPGKRKTDVDIPGRHGSLRGRRKTFEPATVVLKLTIAGCLPDGSVPTGSSEVREMHARVDELLRILGGDLVTIGYVRPDGSTRRIDGDVQDAIDFTRIGVGSAAKVSIAVVAQNPFWADTSTRTQTLTLTTGSSAVLSQFAGSTAPMAEGTVTFGAGSNPQLTQTTTGKLIAYDAVIASGRQLTIDMDTLRLGVGTGSGWTPDPTKLRFAGSRAFELAPEASGPSMTLTHTGGGSMSATVTTTRKYLTA